jgi:hypothetical protein
MKHKELVSNCFTITDEAFALLILFNSEQVWRNQYKEADKKQWKGEAFHFQYTKNRSGRNANSWSLDGRKKFNELCQMIKEKRSSPDTGENFEKEIKKIFIAEEMSKRPNACQQYTGDSGDENYSNEGKEEDFVEFEEEGWKALIGNVTSTAEL